MKVIAPIVALGLIIVLAAWAPVGPKKKVSYTKEIAPILTRSCVTCHGKEHPKEDLDLSSPEGITKGSEHGAVIVAGKSSESKLCTSLVAKGGDRMPRKAAPLPKKEIDLINRWVNEGAKFDTK